MWPTTEHGLAQEVQGHSTRAHIKPSEMYFSYSWHICWPIQLQGDLSSEKHRLARLQKNYKTATCSSKITIHKKASERTTQLQMVSTLGSELRSLCWKLLFSFLLEQSRSAWSALVVWTVAELESPVSTDLAKAIILSPVLSYLLCSAKGTVLFNFTSLFCSSLHVCSDWL